MLKIINTLLIFVCLLLSCKTNNKEVTVNNAINNDTLKFYPLNTLLDNQLEDLAKSPYYIYKKTTIDSKVVDSIPFPLDSLQKVIAKIKSYNIDTAGRKEYYTESSFQDLSTNSISLVYTTTNAAMQVMNQTILLNKGSNELKNALIRITDQSAKTQIQYNFKPNKSLRISTIKFTNNNQEVVEKVFINWNDTVE